MEAQTILRYLYLRRRYSRLILLGSGRWRRCGGDIRRVWQVASVLPAATVPRDMPDCPLADDCPSFTERIEGMGCTHYGDRGGKEWCNHYSQPIDDLKTQPVKVGEEVVVD